MGLCVTANFMKFPAFKLPVDEERFFAVCLIGLLIQLVMQNLVVKASVSLPLAIIQHDLRFKLDTLIC